MQRQWGLIGIGLFGMLAVIMLMMSMSASVQAQFRASPVPYLPGTQIYTPIAPTAVPGLCYPPLPFKVGDLIYIEPGVNLRNMADLSGALAWNTIYENRDEGGGVIDDPQAVAVIIQEGPVCSDSYNWWRVVGTGNPGWVAEGRPDMAGGYFLTGPQIAEATAGCQSAFPLSVGKPVDLVFNVRIRQDPSINARTKTVVPFKTPIQLLSGPRCIEARVWWYVRATVNNFPYEGWMAEGEPDQQYILPENLAATVAEACDWPLRLTIGQRGYVEYNDTEPKALRAEPGVDSTLLVRLVDGVPFVIEGGPICRDNYNWWKIRVLDSVPVIGWMAEGGPANYWMTALDPNEYAK